MTAGVHHTAAHTAAHTHTHTHTGDIRGGGGGGGGQGEADAISSVMESLMSAQDVFMGVLDHAKYLPTKVKAIKISGKLSKVFLQS